MKFLQRVWKDIRQGENLDLYVTVAVSIVLVVLNILGRALPLTAPLSMAILALLAVAILGNRHRLETILQNMARGVHDVFYADFPDSLQKEIVEKIEQAADLLMMGIDLDATLSKHYSLLEQKLGKGDKVRVVLVDPDSSACEMVVRKRYRPTTPASQRLLIRSSLEAMCELRQKTSGKLEIRVIDCPLARGGIIVDPDAPNGVLYIWNHSFKTSRENRPKFVLRAADGYWYDFFREEADAIWNDAVPWQSNKIKSS